jgi:hypothetical protein
MFDKTIRAAHSVDTAVPNSHNLHSSITKKPQKYTDLKGLTRTWKLNAVYLTPLVISTNATIADKSHEILKPLNHSATPYIAKQ